MPVTGNLVRQDKRVRDVAKKLIITVGGVSHEVSHIKMFPAAEVNQWRAMVAQAQTQLGPVSSGIGFIGSPEWVIGGSIVSGILTQGIANASAKAGMETLNRAAALLAQIRSLGRFVAVSEFREAERPHPKAWIAVAPGLKAVDFSRVSMFEKDKFLRQHNRTKADVVNNVLKVDADVEYILLDDEFVTVTTPQGEVHIRWSAVETYQPCEG